MDESNCINEAVPFRPLTYNEHLRQNLEGVTAPGCGVLLSGHYRRLLERHPKNIVRVVLPELLSRSRRSAARFQQAGKLFDRWVKQRVLVEWDKPVVGIYEQAFVFAGSQHRLRGLLAAVRLSDYSIGKILPHEATITSHAESHLRLLALTRANLCPIWGIVPDENGSLRKLLRESAPGEPALRCLDHEGVENQVWFIEQQNLQRGLCQDACRQKILIADGHHRYAAAVAYSQSLQRGKQASSPVPGNYVLMLLVPMNEPDLKLLATHRLIPKSLRIDLHAFLERVNTDFEITKMAGGKGELDRIKYALSELAPRHTFALYTTSASYLLTLKDKSILERKMGNSSGCWRELDVCILEKLLLPDMWELSHRRKGARELVSYTHSIEDAKMQVDGNKFACALLLNPIPVEAVRKLAERGELLPAKSTYFYPKPLLGLVMRRL